MKISAIRRSPRIILDMYGFTDEMYQLALELEPRLKPEIDRYKITIDYRFGEDNNRNIDNYDDTNLLFIRGVYG